MNRIPLSLSIYLSLSLSFVVSDLGRIPTDSRVKEREKERERERGRESGERNRTVVYVLGFQNSVFSAGMTNRFQ